MRPYELIVEEVQPLRLLARMYQPIGLFLTFEEGGSIGWGMIVDEYAHTFPAIGFGNLTTVPIRIRVSYEPRREGFVPIEHTAIQGEDVIIPLRRAHEAYLRRVRVEIDLTGLHPDVQNAKVVITIQFPIRD